MKFKNIVLIFILTSMLTSCISKPPENSVKWKSKYHNLEVEYNAPWGKVNPSLDTEDKTIFGLINKRNGTSYIIKITSDVSKEQVTDEHYYDAIKEVMLVENEKNRLLEEHDIEFHGQIFHQQVYLLYTEKWGLLKQYANTLRTGEKMYGTQISFPVSEAGAEKAAIPQQLIELDKKVKLNEK